MRRLPPISTRTDTLCPYTTLSRSPGRFGKDLGDRNILESEFFGTATDRETRDIERMRMAFDQRSKFEKAVCHGGALRDTSRSEEHTSELQSLMRISYAVYCLKKTKKKAVETTMTLIRPRNMK